MSIVRGKVFDGHRYWSPYGSGTPPDGLPDDSRFHSHAAFGAGAAAPAWVQVPSGVWVLEYDGTADYMDAAAADTTQMDIVTREYTILCWLNWVDTGQAEILIGRYHLDNDGWEIYLDETAGVYYLTQRHHHAGTIVDTHPRSASYSVGWTPETTYFLAIVFQGNGTDCLHYRNGVALAVTSSTGGIRNPESCNQDLVFGIRFCKTANWYEGWHSPIVMYDYALSQDAINKIYQSERYLR